MSSFHFAYGANMSAAIMRRHAPDARPLGVATLPDHRFLIAGDGYASVGAARGSTVHGVLWKITPRDRIKLDCWENIAAGLYRAEVLPVRRKQCMVPALVYLARGKGEGVPKAGYLELVVEAAASWQLPEAYVESLRRWAGPPARPGSRKLETFP